MKFLFRSCLRLSIFLVLSSWAIPCTGQQQISGTVTNTDKMPIPGVNITFKNKSGGTTTNFDGEYELNAQAQDSLIFAYLGYQTQTIAVTNQTQINITLQKEENSLGDLVINAGYYTTTERERTGSIEKVSAEEIELQPVVNPLQTLQGRMPGVEVVQQSGVTGLAASIQIRGQNSLRNSPGNNGNQPLFIVDGVPINSSPVRTSGLLTNVPGLDPLNALNLANIESIEVLKDADATAIYGSRGANGVVLITTKKAKNQGGKLQIEARLYSGFSEVSHQMELLNTQEYIAMRQQALANDGVEATQYNAPDLVLWDQNRYTDWQEELFGQTASITNANIAVASGNETTSFNLGTGYHKESTVFPGDFGYQKLTANVNINHHAKDQKLQLNFSANYGVDQNKLFNNSLVSLATSLPPNAPPIYTESGELNWENWVWEGNPIAQLEKKHTVSSTNLFTNFNFSYELFKNLNFKTNLGYSHLNNNEVLKNPKLAYNPENWNNIYSSSTHTDIQRKSWIVEPQITYTFKKDKLQLEALAGLTFQQSQDDLLVVIGNNYSNEQTIGNLTAAEEVRVNTDETIDYRYSAVFGRVGVNWDQKYYVNFTGRRDGSSRFGAENRFANFGAIGAAWIFSEEEYAKNVEWLSFGKLRASYGSTGSDQIPDYGFMDTYEPTPGPGGLYPTQLTNPEYSWEVNKKLEAALELGLIDNRIQFDLSWYRNRSSNQLVGYPLPSITGFTSVQANFPATVQNTGWELGLTTRNFTSEKLKWSTSINLTIPRNELVAFENIEQSPYQNIYRVGEPLNIALRYRYLGINPETGFYQVEDINNDGSYNYDDRVVIQNLGRRYYGGLTNTLTWGNVNLQFLLEYVNQKNYNFFTNYTAPGNYGNKPVEVLNAWQQEGDNTIIQQFSQSSTANSAYANAIRSNLSVSDASFLRLKTISLAYNLPIKDLAVGIHNAKLFMHGQNLFTLTDFKGLDPQTGMSLPPLKTITLGVQLNF